MLTRGFISIVVPVFNEGQAVDSFLAELTTVAASLPFRYELIFVNDGSRDDTLERIRAQRAQNPAIGIVDLSRNFGKEAAIVAGLEAAKGAAAIVMDVDLQDPPAVIPEMIEKWRNGADVVIAIRTSRAQDSFFKRTSAGLFYKLFAMLSDVKLPEGSGDFRLMDRRVIDSFLRLDERARFNKGLFAWLGFRQEFVHHARPQANRRGSRWSFRRLFRFGFESILSFSTIPIRVWSAVGGVIAVGALAYGAFLLTRTLVFGRDVPGYASLMVSILFLGGLNLFTLGLVGEYVGQALTEAKRRPLFIVRENLEAAPEEASTEVAER